MRSIALLIILTIVVGLALREVIERNFETEIRMTQEEAKKTEESLKSSMTPRQPAPPTDFRGPTGKPHIIGPSAPPPGY